MFRRLSIGILFITLAAASLPAAPLLYSLGTNDGMSYSLVEIDGRGNENTLFSAGMGYNGGLAFDPVADRFYAIRNDMFGASTLTSITWGGVIEDAMPLGEGFYGGLTYGGTTGQLYAIGAGREGIQNHLYSIDLLGGTVTGEDSLGDGTSFLTAASPQSQTSSTGPAWP